MVSVWKIVFHRGRKHSFAHSAALELGRDNRGQFARKLLRASFSPCPRITKNPFTPTELFSLRALTRLIAPNCLTAMSKPYTICAPSSQKNIYSDEAFITPGILPIISSRALFRKAEFIIGTREG